VLATCTFPQQLQLRAKFGSATRLLTQDTRHALVLAALRLATVPSGEARLLGGLHIAEPHLRDRLVVGKTSAGDRLGRPDATQVDAARRHPLRNQIVSNGFRAIATERDIDRIIAGVVGMADHGDFGIRASLELVGDLRQLALGPCGQAEAIGLEVDRRRD